MTNPSDYFKKYRISIGFSNQNDAKIFLSAKDISPSVDYDYIKLLNRRIENVVKKINGIANDSYKRNDIRIFCKQYIYHPYKIIQDAGLLPKLNNQGRRPEEVLFSWLRGYTICEYFTPAFSTIFKLPLNSVSQIGEDDLKNIDTFKRSPKADLQIIFNGQIVRIEVQSGFQGISDIKEHKVREAKRVFDNEGIKTVCIHIDLYNGQVAFVRLDAIKDNDVNFITRQQMEGQSVFSIDQNYFKWRLLDSMPNVDDLELEI